jgi:hypothetical protein
MKSDELLGSVTKFYLDSGDFNGLPVASLKLESEAVRELVAPLVESDKLYVNYGDRHPNPHILAFEPESRETQLEKLERDDITPSCLYPSTAHLEGVVHSSDYEGRPYTHELALGHPQLGLHFFELSTLESYRNDPRYHYTFDIDGWIGVHDAHYEQGTMDEKDQVLLQSFGLAIDKKKRWALAVFRRYLHSLSAEHQQIWKAKQEPDDPSRLAPHPDYWRMSMGEWPESISLFSAFVEEIGQIHELCNVIGRKPLFKNTFQEDWPRDFGYLIRPTARELAGFAAVVDKMLSENIDRDFFRNEVPYEDETTDKQGRTIVTQRGTIRILEEWLAVRFRTDDDEPIENAIVTLKNIRKMRNPQAHKIGVDIYDTEYFQKQTDIMRDAYGAVRTLRQVLHLHRKAKDHVVPDYLGEGKILAE